MADFAPVLTSSGQLAWKRQQRTLPGVSQSHSTGDTLRAPWPVLQEILVAKSKEWCRIILARQQWRRLISSTLAWQF